MPIKNLKLMEKIKNITKKVKRTLFLKKKVTQLKNRKNIHQMVPVVKKHLVLAVVKEVEKIHLGQVLLPVEVKVAEAVKVHHHKNN